MSATTIYPIIAKHWISRRKFNNPESKLVGLADAACAAAELAVSNHGVGGRVNYLVGSSNLRGKCILLDAWMSNSHCNADSGQAHVNQTRSSLWSDSWRNMRQPDWLDFTVKRDQRRHGMNTVHTAQHNSRVTFHTVKKENKDSMFQHFVTRLLRLVCEY